MNIRVVAAFFLLNSVIMFCGATEAPVSTWQPYQEHATQYVGDNKSIKTYFSTKRLCPSGVFFLISQRIPREVIIQELNLYFNPPVVGILRPRIFYSIEDSPDVEYVCENFAELTAHLKDAVREESTSENVLFIKAAYKFLMRIKICIREDFSDDIVFKKPLAGCIEEALAFLYTHSQSFAKVKEANSMLSLLIKDLCALLEQDALLSDDEIVARLGALWEASKEATIVTRDSYLQWKVISTYLVAQFVTVQASMNDGSLRVTFIVKDSSWSNHLVRELHLGCQREIVIRLNNACGISDQLEEERTHRSNSCRFLFHKASC